MSSPLKHLQRQFPFPQMCFFPSPHQSTWVAWNGQCRGPVRLPNGGGHGRTYVPLASPLHGNWHTQLQIPPPLLAPLSFLRFSQLSLRPCLSSLHSKHSSLLPLYFSKALIISPFTFRTFMQPLIYLWEPTWRSRDSWTGWATSWWGPLDRRLSGLEGHQQKQRTN